MVQVFNKVRLVEVNKDSVFKLDGLSKVMRKGVKITAEVAAEYNRTAKSSGILYELDEEATAEREQALNPEPQVDRDALKAEATELGIEFHSAIKTDQLIAKIAEAKQ